MSKVKCDGWAIKYDFVGKLYPPVWDSKELLIKSYNQWVPGLWKKHRKAGKVKAVKVRIVEVNDGQ